MTYLIYTNTNSPAWRRHHHWTPKKYRGLNLYVGQDVGQSYTTSLPDAKQFSTVDVATDNKLPYEEVIQVSNKKYNKKYKKK